MSLIGAYRTWRRRLACRCSFVKTTNGKLVCPKCGDTGITIYLWEVVLYAIVTAYVISIIMRS